MRVDRSPIHCHMTPTIDRKRDNGCPLQLAADCLFQTTVLHTKYPLRTICVKEFIDDTYPPSNHFNDASTLPHLVKCNDTNEIIPRLYLIINPSSASNYDGRVLVPKYMRLRIPKFFSTPYSGTHRRADNTNNFSCTIMHLAGMAVRPPTTEHVLVMVSWTTRTRSE